MRHFRIQMPMSCRLIAALSVLLCGLVVPHWRPVTQAAEIPGPAEPLPVATPEPDEEKKDSKYQNFKEAWLVGVGYYNSRNFAGAREPLEAALALAPDDASKLKAYEALIGCYRLDPETGNMTKAVEYVLANSKRDSRKSLIRRSYLSYLHQRGKTKGAVERLEKQLKEKPEDFVPLYLLSEIYTSTDPNPKRATEVITLLNKIAPPKKDDPLAILRQAKLAGQFIKAKDYQAGIDLYRKLAKQDEKLAGLYLKEAALAELLQGKKELALETAREAVKAGPDKRNDQLTYFWCRQLGDFFLEHGDAQEAIPLLKEALTKTQIEGYLKATQEKLDEATSKAN